LHHAVVIMYDSPVYSTTDHLDISAMFGKCFLQVFHFPNPFSK